MTGLAHDLRRECPVGEDDIRRLVFGFYDKVRADADLAPIFATRIEDWAPHLETMCDFWSSMMLGSGRYHGRPMPKHMAFADAARPEHFGVWLRLFRETAHEVFQPGIAAAFIEKAEMVARSLQLGMFGMDSRPVL